MKVSLATPKSRWEFLIWYYSTVLGDAPIEALEIQSLLMCETYERYLRKFTFRTDKLKLSVAEAMALRDCLIAYYQEQQEEDPFTYTIIHELQTAIDHALNTRRVPRIAAPP